MPYNVALAIYQMENELERELNFRNISFEKHDRLYFFHDTYCPLFAQVTWINCQEIPIRSIGDGIKKLKALGKNWALFSIGHHRRAQLIQDGLPKVKDNPIPFLAESPKHPMGGWTLRDADTIICSMQTTSRYPLGKVTFLENKTVPPSRAYLKLWEFFTVHCTPPPAGTHVIDMGSAPGGWSWVLSQLDLKVISVDKALLGHKIAQIPNITFVQESAFALDPQSMSDVQWLFSDIICYPEPLLKMIQHWLKESNVQNVACTVKFQGEVDFDLIDRFLEIPDSKMVHLYHNKHEVMWWKVRSRSVYSGA